MKIALEIGSPDTNSLLAFLREQSSVTLDSSAWEKAECVVAAYDRDTLIGVGKASSPHEMIFVISPEYKHREISVPMSKLLQHLQNSQSSQTAVS